MSSPPISRAGIGVIPAGLAQMNPGINPQDPRYQDILQKVKLGQLNVDDLESAQRVIDWQQKRIERLQGDINSYEKSLEGIVEDGIKKSTSLEELRGSFEDLKSSHDDLLERNKKLEDVPDRLEKIRHECEKTKKEKEKLAKRQTKLMANLQLVQQQNKQLNEQVLQLNKGFCPSSVTEGIVQTLKYLHLDCILPANAVVNGGLAPEDMEELQVKKNPLAED